MNPLSRMNGTDFIKKLFPYTMDFSFVTYWIDESLPLDQQVEQKIEKKMAENLPCSVQSTSTTNNEKEYIILSPCLDLDPKEEIPSGAELKVRMNGKTNTATMREILSIDNLDVYETFGYKVGCKIRVSSACKWTW